MRCLWKISSHTRAESRSDPSIRWGDAWSVRRLNTTSASSPKNLPSQRIQKMNPWRDSKRPGTLACSASLQLWDRMEAENLTSSTPCFSSSESGPSRRVLELSISPAQYYLKAIKSEASGLTCLWCSCDSIRSQSSYTTRASIKTWTQPKWLFISRRLKTR